MPQVFKPNNTNTIAATATSQARAFATTAPGDCAAFYNDGPSLVLVCTGGSTLVATLPALSTNVGAQGNATPVPVGASINLTHANTDTHWAAICPAGGTANVYCTPGTGH